MEDLEKYKVSKGGQYLDEDNNCQKLRIRKNVKNTWGNFGELRVNKFPSYLSQKFKRDIVLDL